MTLDDNLELRPLELIASDVFDDMSGTSLGVSNFPGTNSVDRCMQVNRVDKHERPKGRVAAKLRKLGLSVKEAPSACSYDLLINDEIRVTLRVAYPGLRRHRVTVGGKSYRYRYETWHFNFHHHGRLKDQYTDFFICIAIDPARSSREQVFVIPWQSVSGKTFSLHSGRGRYRGRYAPFSDAWEDIATEARARAKELPRVA